PTRKRFPLLLRAARDERLGEAVRAQAILGLAEQAPQHLDALLSLARGDNAVLSDEALRALVGVELKADRRAALEEVSRRRPVAAPLVARAVGRPCARARPPAKDLDAWSKRLAGPADAGTGRRVFFHPKLAGCYRCHRVEGRGQDVGPDLSTVGRN